MHRYPIVIGLNSALAFCKISRFWISGYITELDWEGNAISLDKGDFRWDAERILQDHEMNDSYQKMDTTVGSTAVDWV